MYSPSWRLPISRQGFGFDGRSELRGVNEGLEGERMANVGRRRHWIGPMAAMRFCFLHVKLRFCPVGRTMNA
jgi:hypothetical protein